MSDLLTVSRMRAYRKCARLEHLRYVEGWRPIEESEALRFGTLWHTGMEAWWLAARDRTDRLAAALAAVEGRGTDEYVQATVEELLRGYHNRWQDAPITALGAEEQFRAPLINPDTMQPSRTWTLGGKIDLRCIVEGRHLIGEHKTTSEDIAPGSDYWAKLQMDHQISIYTIGAETMGDPPQGCLYDVVRKPGIRPLKATPEEARKYKKDGTLYAAQRETDETPDEYRARLREDIEANPDKYFARLDVPRTESQLRDFLADAWAQGRAMRESHLAGRAPRNPEACHAYGRCSFWDVCSTGSDPADMPDKYRRHEEVHPELADEVAA